MKLRIYSEPESESGDVLVFVEADGDTLLALTPDQAMAVSEMLEDAAMVAVATELAEVAGDDEPDLVH